MLYFQQQPTLINSVNTIPDQCEEQQPVVINPYSQNLNDFDNDLKLLLEKNRLRFNSLQQNTIQQRQKGIVLSNPVILEIEKVKYRIDADRRLQKLIEVFSKYNFPYTLRLVLNGDQVIQQEEIEKLKKVLQSKQSFSQVEIWINQVDNQYDWNLLELLSFKQIGTLILRIDKTCAQSLRSLAAPVSKVRVLSKAIFILQEDVPMKVFEFFAWPAKIQLEVQESMHQSSTLKLQFLLNLRFISQLEIKYFDNTSYATHSIMLPILTSQLEQVSKIDRINFSYIEQFSSSLHPNTLKNAALTRNQLDYSLFLPYERYLSTYIKSEKFNAEKQFYSILSKRNLLEISLTITINQIVQLFELFQKQSSFVKLFIKVIPNSFNMYPQTFTKEKEDEKNIINTLDTLQIQSVSIKNLTLICEKSLSNDNSDTLYNRFSQLCIYILVCKTTKLNLTIQKMQECDFEKIAKRIKENPHLKHLNIIFKRKVAFNNNAIMYMASANILSMSCCINNKSYQFFYELFLNIKSLQALHMKIEQVPQISERFFSLLTPYIYLQLSQQINYKQKMTIFSNKNIFLYFNTSESQKKTFFSSVYYNNLSLLLTLNAIQKKCAFSNEKSLFQTSILELLMN